MSDQLGLVPVARRGRKGCASYTLYMVTADLDALIKGKDVIFLSLPPDEVTQAAVLVAAGEQIAVERLEAERGVWCVPWEKRRAQAGDFAVRIWDHPVFRDVNEEEALLLAAEHGGAIFPTSSIQSAPRNDEKTVILEDRYLLKPSHESYTLIEHDPVKALRLALRRLNHEGKKKRVARRLSLDDLHTISSRIRESIREHPTLKAAGGWVLTIDYGFPRDRDSGCSCALGCIRTAKAFFGRKKPWRGNLKEFLTDRREIVFRALQNSRVSGDERKLMEWLLAEMVAMRVPGVKAWLENNVQSKPKRRAAS